MTDYEENIQRNASNFSVIANIAGDLYEIKGRDENLRKDLLSIFPDLTVDCIATIAEYFHKTRYQANPETIRSMRYAIDSMLEIVRTLREDSSIDITPSDGDDENAE